MRKSLIVAGAITIGFSLMPSIYITEAAACPAGSTFFPPVRGHGVPACFWTGKGNAIAAQCITYDQKSGMKNQACESGWREYRRGGVRYCCSTRAYKRNR